MGKKVLVTLQERRRIAKEATVQMGSKVTYKVIDVEKVAMWLREERKAKNLSPYIEIQPISADQFKNPHKQATYQKDPITGVLYGIALSADEFGNIRWQKIQLQESLSLNMDNENDARIWSVLRFNPDILGSPFQRENPYFKIYDPVDEAIAEQQEVLAMQRAFERVSKLIKNPKGMVQFARYIGEEVMDNTNYDIIHGLLLKNARHRPAMFNEMWESRARSFAENFQSALSLDIITEDANSGYHFKGLSLGMSQEDAIKMLSKDGTVMNAISEALNEFDLAVKNVAETAPKEESKAEPKKEVVKTEENEFE